MRTWLKDLWNIWKPGVLGVALGFVVIGVMETVHAQSTPSAVASTFVESYAPEPDTVNPGAIAVHVLPGATLKPQEPLELQLGQDFYMDVYVQNLTAPINRIEWSVLYDGFAVWPVMTGAAPWLSVEFAQGDTQALYGRVDDVIVDGFLRRLTGAVSFSQPLTKDSVIVKIHMRAKGPGLSPLILDKMSADGRPEWQYRIRFDRCAILKVEGNLPPCK